MRAVDRMAAVGSASCWPAMSGAEPWTGSNIDGAVRSGFTLPLAAVLSAAMLARFLGEDKAADRMEGAVGAVLSKLGGTTAATMGHSTSEVGDLVAEVIGGLDLPPQRHMDQEA